jgi:hypothetical protein
LIIFSIVVNFLDVRADEVACVGSRVNVEVVANVKYRQYRNVNIVQVEIEFTITKNSGIVRYLRTFAAVQHFRLNGESPGNGQLGKEARMDVGFDIVVVDLRFIEVGQIQSSLDSEGRREHVAGWRLFLRTKSCGC